MIFCSLPREKLRPAQRAKKHARCDNCDNWTAVFAHHIGGRNIRGIRCIKYNYYYIYLFIYIFYLSSRPCEKIGCHLSQLSQDGTTRSTRPFRSEQEAVPLGARGRSARSKKRPQKAQGRFASSKIGFFNSLHEIIWKRLFFFVSLQPKRVYKAARLAFVSFRQWTLRHTISMYY